MTNQFKFDSEHLFFVSDTHFNHSNIIKYCSRPFSSTEEMDEALIKNWNSVITDNDTIFHLGDFAFGGFPVWERIRPQLNGSIILILGNHDHANINPRNKQRIEAMFDWVGEMLTISVGKRHIILSHYPLMCYPDGCYNLHGHIHSGPNSTSKDVLNNMFKSTQYDVGVDNNNYTPVSYSQVKYIINKQLNEDT